MIQSRDYFVTFRDKFLYRILLSYVKRNEKSARKESCILIFLTTLREQFFFLA